MKFFKLNLLHKITHEDSGVLFVNLDNMCEVSLECGSPYDMTTEKFWDEKSGGQLIREKRITPIKDCLKVLYLGQNGPTFYHADFEENNFRDLIMAL